MPYYFITVLLHDGKLIKGLKENLDSRIDIVWRFYLAESQKHYRQIKEYHCVMISKQSSIYIDWLEKRNKKVEDRRFGDEETSKPFTGNLTRKEQFKDRQGDWGDTFKKSKEF